MPRQNTMRTRRSWRNQNRMWKDMAGPAVHNKWRTPESPCSLPPIHEEPEPDRLFAGVYPCGIVYADRKREKAGGYMRLAFLDYATLTLSFDKNPCPKWLREQIIADAAKIQACAGQDFQVSTCGQFVRLGGTAKEVAR